MNNEDKIRVKLTLPGEDPKKFACDFVIAALTNSDGKNNHLISCGGSNIHNLVTVWCKALVSALKEVNPDAKLRSISYDFAIYTLKELIKDKDPEAIDEEGNLIAPRFIETFLNGILKDFVEAKG